MTFDEYMVETRRCRPSDDVSTQLINAGLGIAGEAGEVAEIIKKWHTHGLPIDSEKLKKELGDVLWYASRLADLMIGSLEEVAAANVAKLRARYPEGFKQGGGNREGEGA